MKRARSGPMSALLAIAVVAAGCSSSPSTTTNGVTTTGIDAPGTGSTEPATTTTTEPPVTTAAVAPRPPAEIPTFEDDAEVIEADDAVVIGALDNGLTYYIRSNDRPGGRAQLRLVVRAGSVQEEPDQSGGAHFLEHMLFNGTEKYPANELIAVLQGFGSEFGPDINAYTNWEETVYELTLPTDRAELLPSGFDVLREWAAAATIDPAEVDLERGVMVEEWRLRSQTFGGRYLEGVIDRLLAGTPYEGQSTLASPDVVESTTSEALRAFYRDWYRPDNLAVVAVGDFDVAAVEALIVGAFGGLPGRDGPARPDLFTEPAAEPSYFVLADPEFAQSFVELNYPLPSLAPGTVGALRQEIAFGLAWEMLVTRLEEDALRGAAPFFGPSFAANPLVRTQQSPGLFAYADPADLMPAAEALLTEVERALVHGFGRDELDRAVEAERTNVDLAFDRSGTTQDAEYADRYVRHFLGGDPIESAERAATLRRRLLDEMTVDQVTATFRANVQATEPLVIAVGPEADAVILPTEEDLAALLDRVRSSDIAPRTDSVEDIEALMVPPDPAAVLERSALPDTTLEVLTLENGVRVILLPTDIVGNVVVVGGLSFGGWSLVPIEDAAEAQLISSVVTQSGVGEYDQVTLERFLSDRVVFVTPYVEETTEGIFGRASTGDLETLFQLVHLYMSRPVADTVGLRLTLDEIRPFAEDRGNDPRLAVALEQATVRFGGDPRFLPLPPLEDLDTFDLDRALGVYRERFGNAGDFVFVVAGDIDPAAAEDLARRYLGTLPSTGSAETYGDVRVPRPAGVVERVVASGSGQLGELSLLWDAPFTLDPSTRVEADLLDLVIRQRLTERIREELSATYSPITAVTIVDDPVPSLELSISISADPADLDAIAAEVIADLTDLRENGPTVEQMLIAQEQLTRDLELFSNELLIDLLTFYLLRPSEQPGDIFLAAQRAQDATRNDLRDLAAALVSLDDYIQIELVPDGFGG